VSFYLMLMRTLSVPVMTMSRLYRLNWFVVNITHLKYPQYPDQLSVAVPHDVMFSQSEYTFCHQLKNGFSRSLFWTSSSDTD